MIEISKSTLAEAKKYIPLQPGEKKIQIPTDKDLWIITDEKEEGFTPLGIIDEITGVKYFLAIKKR
ncbi:hypothetical protein ISS03_01340 [Patescibacteria group bacterium]|nr:hypothetical protein [Patescibacteria group bacterium]